MYRPSINKILRFTFESFLVFINSSVARVASITITRHARTSMMVDMVPQVSFGVIDLKTYLFIVDKPITYSSLVKMNLNKKEIASLLCDKANSLAKTNIEKYK